MESGVCRFVTYQQSATRALHSSNCLFRILELTSCFVETNSGKLVGDRWRERETSEKKKK